MTIPEGDDETVVGQAVAEAELPALLGALAHRTGDRSLLDSEWRPDQQRLLEPDAGVSSAAPAGSVVQSTRDLSGRAARARQP